MDQLGHTTFRQELDKANVTYKHYSTSRSNSDNERLDSLVDDLEDTLMNN